MMGTQVRHCKGTWIRRGTDTQAPRVRRKGTQASRRVGARTRPREYRTGGHTRPKRTLRQSPYTWSPFRGSRGRYTASSRRTRT
jgi:hypothetical protein